MNVVVKMLNLWSYKILDVVKCMKTHHQPGKWLLNHTLRGMPKEDENKEHLGFLPENLEQIYEKGHGLQFLMFPNKLLIWNRNLT